MITKTTKVDRIEVVGNAYVQVRENIEISEDGVKISETKHRKTLTIESDWSGEEQLVQDICALVFE